MIGYREVCKETTERLAEILRQSGRSQRELAESLGMTQSAISATLRGRYPDLRVSTLVRLATGLGYQVRIVMEKVEKAADS